MTASPTVLITGAARRIGRAVALDFARQGWQVGVHYSRSAPDAEALAEEIQASGGRAAAIKADLAEPSELATLVNRAARLLGPVTCLVNNASAFLSDTAQSMTPEIWERHISVNLKAPVMLAQAFFRALPDGEHGNIVNIIDQRVLRPTPDFFSYSVSKAGLWAATRTMAQSFAPRVRVNAIGPGPVLQSVHQSPEEFATEQAETPLQRGTTPEEIAAAIRFILSAPAMTGQLIALDGGQHLDWRRTESSR